MATSSGFPPRCAMLSRIHCRASTWKWTHWYCCVMNSNFGYRTGPSTKGNWVKILTNLVPQQRVIGCTDDDKPGPSILDFLKPCQNQGWAPPKDRGGSLLSQRPPCNCNTLSSDFVFEIQEIPGSPWWSEVHTCQPSQKQDHRHGTKQALKWQWKIQNQSQFKCWCHIQRCKNAQTVQYQKWKQLVQTKWFQSSDLMPSVTWQGGVDISRENMQDKTILVAHVGSFCVFWWTPVDIFQKKFSKALSGDSYRQQKWI